MVPKEHQLFWFIDKNNEPACWCYRAPLDTYKQMVRSATGRKKLEALYEAEDLLNKYASKEEALTKIHDKETRYY